MTTTLTERGVSRLMRQDEVGESGAGQGLYVSPWFQLARAYVERTGQPWFILSAEYGLLDPDQVIAPYDRMLVHMPADERRAWARNVG